jgi:hypothetical protein
VSEVSSILSFPCLSSLGIIYRELHVPAMLSFPPQKCDKCTNNEKYLQEVNVVDGVSTP